MLLSHLHTPSYVLLTTYVFSLSRLRAPPYRLWGTSTFVFVRVHTFSLLLLLTSMCSERVVRLTCTVVMLFAFAVHVMHSHSKCCAQDLCHPQQHGLAMRQLRRWRHECRIHWHEMVSTVENDTFQIDNIYNLLIIVSPGAHSCGLRSDHGIQTTFLKCQDFSRFEDLCENVYHVLGWIRYYSPNRFIGRVSHCIV